MEAILELKDKDFKFGVFTKDFNFVSPENTDKLHISLEKTQLDKNSTELQLIVKNICDTPIRVNSLMVADFVLQDYHPQKILQNGWGQSSFSGYKNKIVSTKKPLLFFKRDHNPFSFRKDFGYLENTLVSEWYTQLVGTKTSLVIGATTIKDQFTQIYLKTEQSEIHIRITCQLDSIEIKPQDYVKSEKIILITGEIETSLETFANLVKNTNKIHSLPNTIRGLCCAYYQQGNKVNEQYILDQLNIIDKFSGKLNFNCVQIDAGYSKLGDWLENAKHFPNGMSDIAQAIKKRQMKVGIWLAPFVASPNSKLYKEHPDWFLEDSKGHKMEARFTSPFDFLPFLSLRVLDITNPDVQKYLETVIKTFVSWGFDYIKLDFTYPICFSTAYKNPMTRAQALRLGFELIKNAAGDSVSIQTGITQLSPLVGIVDYVRVGLDTINPFVQKVPIINTLINTYMLRENLRNCSARQFLNNKIWVNDADCLVCRPHIGLSIKDIQRHFEFIYTYQGSIWIGDSLTKLNSKTLDKYIAPLLNIKGK